MSEKQNDSRAKEATERAIESIWAFVHGYLGASVPKVGDKRHVLLKEIFDTYRKEIENTKATPGAIKALEGVRDVVKKAVAYRSEYFNKRGTRVTKPWYLRRADVRKIINAAIEKERKTHENKEFQD